PKVHHQLGAHGSGIGTDFRDHKLEGVAEEVTSCCRAANASKTRTRLEIRYADTSEVRLLAALLNSQGFRHDGTRTRQHGRSAMASASQTAAGEEMYACYRCWSIVPVFAAGPRSGQRTD